MSSAGPTTWPLTVVGKEGELVLGGEEGALSGGTCVLVSWPVVSPPKDSLQQWVWSWLRASSQPPWSWLLPANVTAENRSGALP